MEKMYVIKRDGTEKLFDIDKITNAITNANKDEDTTEKISKEIIDKISANVYKKCIDLSRAVSVEEIQDIVEDQLLTYGNYNIAKCYIKYRYKRSLARKSSQTDDIIMSLIEYNNEEVKQENSNKNPMINSVQRDYMAGEISRDISNRILLPEDVVKAHDQGIIHFHDSDYFTQHMFNCQLINLEDMLQNGTVISGTTIDKPHSFMTACNVATQIIAQVASNQYGGQSITLSHLAPFVDISRNKIRSRVEEELLSQDIEVTEKMINSITEKRLLEEIQQGIQTIQYQVITLMTTNGQAPFITVFMYINEVPEGRTRDDLAMIIREMLNIRIKGIKNEKGVYTTPAFPKLIYVLEENNITEDSEYWDLTVLAAKCTAKRLVPDYISEKKMLELKVDENGEGHCYPCMGAARGDETVSIKIYDQEFNDIKIKDAVNIIKTFNKFISTPNSMKMEYPDIEFDNIEVFISGDLILEDLGVKDDDILNNPEFEIPHYYIKDFINKPGIFKLDIITEYHDPVVYFGSTIDLGRRMGEINSELVKLGLLKRWYSFKVLSVCDIDQLDEYLNKIDWMKLPGSQNHNVTVLTDFNEILKRFGPSHNTDFNIGTNYIKIYDSRIQIKSCNNYVPIRGIMINSELCPLKLVNISYANDYGKYKTICVTEDHPLHTYRGRIKSIDLMVGDILYNSINGNEYRIISICVSDEHVPTYDFETDNDMFDLSGIVSHNCRSFLTTYLDENGKPKYYGRFNQGVVTINLPDVALSSKKDVDAFWKIFDERLELCYKALMCRHNRLKGTPSDVSPIHWQYGAVSRLKKGETIDKLLYGGYSTISLGYAGLYECVKYMTGKSHTENDGFEFAISVMKHLNEACAKWKEETNIAFSLYGSPIESTTYKFAKCLQKRFGIIEGITDRSYITNSYHVNVREKINAFDKLSIESNFQELSPGGAISYVEVPNMQNNIPAVLTVLKHIYENIMYAELNTKSDYCQVCGYDGEIVIKEENNKYIWECPNCGNKDQNKMNVARRTCGLTNLYSPR